MTAYCYRSGQIYLQSNKRPLPKGAIPLGSHRHIREALGPLIRWAHNNKTMLIPGVPEADTNEEAYAALIKFEEQVRERLNRLIASQG